jgi:hypothetical protein
MFSPVFIYSYGAFPLDTPGNWKEIQKKIRFPIQSLDEIHWLEPGQLNWILDFPDGSGIAQEIWCLPSIHQQLLLLNLLINRVSANQANAIMLAEYKTNSFHYIIFGAPAFVGKLNLLPDFEIQFTGLKKVDNFAEWLNTIPVESESINHETTFDTNEIFFIGHFTAILKRSNSSPFLIYNWIPGSLVNCFIEKI